VKPEDTGESIEDNALAWDQIRKASYQKSLALQSKVNSLTENHNKRVAVNPEFSYIQEDIIKYKQELDSKTISLKESVRIKEREESEAIRLTRLNERLVRKELPTVKSFDDKPEDFEFDDTFLLEAANIAIDLSKSS